MSQVCSIEGCEKIYIARTFCGKHYQRLRKTGSPLKVLKEQSNRGLFIKECNISGCKTKPHARQLCDMHYKSRQRSECREYGIWTDIRQRCLNPNDPCYPGYGGRGIKICDRWLESFHNFFNDVGQRPTSKHQLDRIDNDGNYEPSNCRWATRVEQANNKRNNVLLTAFGKTLTSAQWGRELGLKPATIRRRLKYNWSPEKVLTFIKE